MSRVKDTEDVEIVDADEDVEETEGFNEEELATLNVVNNDEHAFLEDEPKEEGEEVFATNLSGTELEAYASAEIEEQEELAEDRIMSIVESVLFATDRPVTVATIKQAFKGTKVKSAQIRRALDQLQIDYADGRRGVTLEEVASGYQLRTKLDNMDYLRLMAKARPFKLSGPALEVLSIVAYKQPLIKAEIDQIRGVESGHLLRALMEKNLVAFAGRSELPGKPMLYQSTRRFLEIFGLRNLKELPSISEIDELIPEGIGDVEEKEKLSDITGQLSQEVAGTYSQGEEELVKISDELAQIDVSSEFFEEEKRRQKEKRDRERAQDIREALAMNEKVEDKDRKWLERYEQSQKEQAQELADIEFVAEAVVPASIDTSGGDLKA